MPCAAWRGNGIIHTMKKRIAFLLAVLAVLAAATALADMPRRGAAVFADGFDQPGTFAENWGQPHGKVKSEEGRMVANAIGTVTKATPARTAPLDVLIEGSIAILDEGRRVGWTGFSLDGYLFLLKPGGSSWLNLNKKLKSADNGKCVRIGGYKTGDSVKLTVVRRKRGGLRLRICGQNRLVFVNCNLGEGLHRS